MSGTWLDMSRFICNVCKNFWISPSHGYLSFMLFVILDLALVFDFTYDFWLWLWFLLSRVKKICWLRARVGGFGFGRVGSGSAEVKNYPKLISSNLKWPIYAAPKQLKNAMLWLICDRKVIWVVGNDGNEGKFRLD